MFKHKTSGKIITQKEHARLAAQIATHLIEWGVITPSVGKDNFVAAVLLHQEGYPDYDTVDFMNFDPIADREKLLAVFTADSDVEFTDPHVTILVLKHQLRLLAEGRIPQDPWEGYLQLQKNLELRIGELITVNNLDAASLDVDMRLVQLCDRASFIWCKGEEATENIETLGINYGTDGDTIWLQVETSGIRGVGCLVQAFAPENYPDQLEKSTLFAEIRLK